MEKLKIVTWVVGQTNTPAILDGLRLIRFAQFALPEFNVTVEAAMLPDVAVLVASCQKPAAFAR